MAGERVLVVDDEPSVLRMLEIGLQDGRYEIRTASTGLDAVEIARHWQPELILLDLVITDFDGDEVCRRLRSFTTAPVIILTALRREQITARCLEAGVDEVVSKPFSVAELSGRVQAALQRRAWTSELLAQPEINWEHGRSRVDAMRRILLRDDEVVPLSSTQYRLLTYLAVSADRVVPYDEVIDRVWGPEYADDLALLATHLALLQRQTEDTARQRRAIANVEGSGLQFVGR